LLVADGWFRVAHNNPLTARHRPQAAHRKPQTANHKPQTTNRKPQTANHKPQTTPFSKKSRFSIFAPLKRQSIGPSNEMLNGYEHYH